MLFILKFLRFCGMSIILFGMHGTTLMAQTKGRANEGVIELIDQMRSLEQGLRDLRGEVEVMRNEQNALKEALSQLKTMNKANEQQAEVSIDGIGSVPKPPQETNDQLKNLTPVSKENPTSIASKVDAIKIDGVDTTQVDTRKSTEENDVATTLFNAAKDAFDQSLYEESKEAFQSFLKTFSSEPRVFAANLYLAKIAEIQKEPNVAIAHLNSFSVSAPAHHPLMPEVLFMLAKLYTQIGRVNDAKLVLDRLANEYPTSPESLKANLGRYD